MADREPTEIQSPGDSIKRFLEERGWTQIELAEVMGRSDAEVSAFILGKRAISLDVARELGAAFGTDAEFWMDLEARYQLSRSRDVDGRIAQRARLYQFAPVREMVKRGWLKPSGDVDALEGNLRKFFGVSSMDQPVELPHATRKRTQGISPAQWAWIFRAKHLAMAAPCTGTFSSRSLDHALKQLKELLISPQEARQVPEILADAGIRFLVLEHLSQTRVDGVTLWLNTKAPVIALSFRYDRVDCFWHTLAHELGHVMKRDGMTRVMLDTDITGEGFESPEGDAEAEADEFAANFLVQRSELENFIARVRPLYGTQRIAGFAKRIGVHPGIVVGQLQFRGEIGWSSFRPMLEKIRGVVTQSALTDGWGHVAPQVPY